MSGNARTPYDSKSKSFDLGRQKVTDYKKNSRVTLPRAQSSEKESKLEVAREEHAKWVKTH